MRRMLYCALAHREDKDEEVLPDTVSGAAWPGAAGGLQPRALPAQVSSPEVSRKQPEGPECADTRPVASGLIGPLWPGRRSSGSGTTWQAALGVRGDIPTKCRRRCPFSSGCGCGRAGERHREKAAFKRSPTVVPAGARDQRAQASEVQRRGRSLREESRQLPT